MKPLSCVEQLDAMQTYLDAMQKAHQEEDWPRLQALAAAAQAHLGAAEFLRRVSERPTVFDGRAAQRWRDAAGIPGR